MRHTLAAGLGKQFSGAWAVFSTDGSRLQAGKKFERLYL